MEGQEQEVLPRLSSEEIKSLPQGDSREILKSAQFSVESVGGDIGFNLIKMQLDQSLLTQSNYKTKVQVKLTGPGKNQTELRIYELQHLALQAFQFPTVWGSANSGIVNMQAEIRILNSGWREKDRLAKYELQYFPEISDVEIRKLTAK
jgi:hypothetical protein